MASEATGKRVIKIKLKLNGQTVARIGPGYAGPVSRDGKDSKAGLLAQAQRRQAALRGYVPPSASADAIVARIRDGEGFAPGDELPDWDFSVLLPPCSQERPAKRARLVDVAEVPCTCGDHGPEPCSDKAHDRQAAAARKTSQLPQGRADPAATVGGSGESNSDQATNSQAYLPLSPEDGGEGAARVGTAGGIPRPNGSSAGQSALAAPASSHQGKPAAASQRQTAGPSAVAGGGRGATAAGKAGAAKDANAGAAAGPRSGGTAATAAPVTKAAAASVVGATAAAAGDGPSSSGRPPRPPGVSVQTQTSGREFPVLPPLFLGLAGLNSQATAYNSIGPFDLQLEHDARGGVGPADGRIDAHMQQARSTKKEGDALMARNGNVWTVKSMSKYVSGALMYMEAADALQRGHNQHSAARAANLYRDTAVLLAHVANNADSIRAAGVVGKEALRLLAERLCAVCLMRQTMLMAQSFRNCEHKARLALKEHQKQQAAAAATGSGGGASVGQRPSPGDSNTSSLRAAANGAGASAADGGGSGSGGGGTGAGGLAGFSHEQVSELLTYARTTSKFSEYMRRSTKGLQDFMERADVQADQQAKLMCMHLAAVCMDMGMTPGLRVIHHAREAVRTLCEDFAR